MRWWVDSLIAELSTQDSTLRTNSLHIQDGETLDSLSLRSFLTSWQQRLCCMLAQELQSHTACSQTPILLHGACVIQANPFPSLCLRFSIWKDRIHHPPYRAVMRTSCWVFSRCLEQCLAQSVVSMLLQSQDRSEWRKQAGSIPWEPPENVVEGITGKLARKGLQTAALP